MGTPEERLRRRAQELQAEKASRDRESEEQERQNRAELQAQARTASAEADAWLRRLRELVDATKMRLPIHVDMDLEEGPGFEIRVGTALWRALLGPDGWHVTKASHSLPSGTGTGLPLDIAAMRENVLERMVEIGLDDLVQGRVEPAPEWGR